MQRVVREISRFSILPILFISEIVYFFYYIVVRDQCTGTNSGYFSTMLICQRVWNCFFGLDFLIVSGVILFIWIFHYQVRYIGLLRAIFLLHLLIFRYMAIWLSSFIQVQPFVPWSYIKWKIWVSCKFVWYNWLGRVGICRFRTLRYTHRALSVRNRPKKRILSRR